MTHPTKSKHNGRMPGIRADQPRLTVPEAIELHRRTSAPGSAVHVTDLSDIVVEGVLTRVRPPAKSGHKYFWLADPDSGDRLEVFLRRWRARAIPFPLINGERVRIEGALQWYEPERRLQLVPGWIERVLQPTVPSTVPQRVGTAATTAWDPPAMPAVLVASRRGAPSYPTVIGLVTSPSSVARGDVAEVVARRAPWVEVRLAPVPLEGDGAAEAIAAAIGELGRTGVDLILLARGGAPGGYAPFDDVRVARAVIASAVPVVTGIGHAQDRTLACQVADAAYATPGAAAAAITERWAALLSRDGQGWLADLERVVHLARREDHADRIAVQRALERLRDRCG